MNCFFFLLKEQHNDCSHNTQTTFISFLKSFYSVLNLKKKNKSSPLLHNPIRKQNLNEQQETEIEGKNF